MEKRHWILNYVEPYDRRTMHSEVVFGTIDQVQNYLEKRFAISSFELYHSRYCAAISKAEQDLNFADCDVWIGPTEILTL